MLAPELLDAIRREISVECHATDLELIDDVADEGVVFGGLEASAGVLDDQPPLELVEGRGHAEEQPSLGRARVDTLG